MVYWLDIQSFCKAFSPLLLLAVLLPIVITPVLLCLQASLFVAVTLQESVFMPSAWRSCLHTSLKHSWAHPVGLFPVASSPYKRSFGMQPSFIRVTCPSHRMRLCFKRVYKLGIPAFSSTTLFVTLSCHVIPRIRLRQRMWNTFNLFSWFACIVQDSLP